MKTLLKTVFPNNSNRNKRIMRKARFALFVILGACAAVYIILFNLSIPWNEHYNRMYSWANEARTFFSYSPKLSDDLQWIPECHCSRPYFYSSSSENIKIKSSCSDEGTFQISNQSVISFSMYFHPKYAPADLKNLYRKDINKNLLEMRKYYPGYSMRVYTNTPLKGQGQGQQWCQLICNNSDLFWCNIKKSPTLGNKSHMNFMIWRFLPLGDPSVDVFLSRDLDSVVTEREAAAVRDWLELPEKKAIQLMRDKAFAHDTAILGGMWGARNSFFGKGNNESVHSLLWSILDACKFTLFTTGRGFDKETLREMLYERRMHQIVAYDSYSCEKYSKETLVRPFPIQRKNAESDFVGNPAFRQAKYQLLECPLACRPSYGQDWKYC